MACRGRKEALTRILSENLSPIDGQEVGLAFGLLDLAEKFFPSFWRDDPLVPKPSQEDVQGFPHSLELNAGCHKRVTFDVSDILKDREEASGLYQKQ
jgi:hypothetical protein